VCQGEKDQQSGSNPVEQASTHLANLSIV